MLIAHWRGQQGVSKEFKLDYTMLGRDRVTKESDGYSTDDQARKRKPEEKEMDESFRRSKKTIRTPIKNQDINGDKLDVILQSMQEMKLDLTREIHQVREDQRKYIEEIEKLQLENVKLKRENVVIREELEEIKLSVERMDKDRRKNNVVISGLEIDTEDTTALKEKVEGFIEQKMGVAIQVKEVHRLGEKTCLISMGNEKDKEQIMKNKYKLKNSSDATVYINNDMTKKERERYRDS